MTKLYSQAEYDTQLASKSEQTREQFAPFNAPALTVFPSPINHFRMRAEFKVWHDGDSCHFVMHEPGNPKAIYRVDQFPIACEQINHLMPQLLELINGNDVLRRKLFQCEFLATTNDQCLITLIYHRQLDDQWQAQAKVLSETLGCSVIGRARKQKRVLSQDWVLETLTVGGVAYDYEHVEASFTQPNAAICESMLNWAFEQTQASETASSDLLELYCGNGNFTLPLAKNFSRVLATEISKTSVDSAKRNMARNAVTNIEFARLSSEEFTQALEGTREFRRLAEIDLASYNFSTVFVDPPRAGLDDGTCKLIARFNRIVYISCNPDTLARDLTTLCQTHSLTALALFDQFPYTHHRECGVVLERKS